MATVDKNSVMMSFSRESEIEASPSAVFAFHESPNALKMLIPPWEPMRIVDSTGSIQIGSRVILEGRVLGFLPVRWIAEHVEYDPPHLFADIQVSGPFRKWYHRHRILDNGKGATILRDEIEYQLPFGLLGKWLGNWLVKRKLHRMFEFRHRVTKLELENAERGRSN